MRPVKKTQDKNGHPRRFPTLAGMFAYCDKPSKGRYKPKMPLVDHPNFRVPGKYVRRFK